MVNPLFDSYTKSESDDTVTAFENEPGLSIVRYYPKNTPQFLDDLRMFIRVADTNRGFYYSVDMAKPRAEEQGVYSLIDAKDYKSKIVTNFISDYSQYDSFFFDKSQNAIVYRSTGKKFTVNEFVEILAKNHLMDRGYWKRKLDIVVSLLLKVIFWMVDRHFERSEVFLEKYKFIREGNVPEVKEDKREPEPFLKYFLIPKNFISIVLVFALLVRSLSEFSPFSPLQQLWTFGEFSLSNPILIAHIFLILLLSEKLSLKLISEIDYFYRRKRDDQAPNIIEKMFSYEHRHRFKLKVK